MILCLSRQTVLSGSSGLTVQCLVPHLGSVIRSVHDLGRVSVVLRFFFLAETSSRRGFFLERSERTAAGCTSCSLRSTRLSGRCTTRLGGEKREPAVHLIPTQFWCSLDGRVYRGWSAFSLQQRLLPTFYSWLPPSLQ